MALLDFAAWYNTHWLVARHGHRTPAQIRADQQPVMNHGRMNDAAACLTTLMQYRVCEGRGFRSGLRGAPVRWPIMRSPGNPKRKSQFKME